MSHHTEDHTSLVDIILSPLGIFMALAFLLIFSVVAYLFSHPSLFPNLFSVLNMVTTKPNNSQLSIINSQLPPSPSPYPLPQGKQVFNMSHGKAVPGPKPSQVTINPYDPQVGEKQTITLDVRYDSAIASGTITLATDEKTEKYDLTKISGTNGKSTWETTITTNDTHDYIYNVAIELTGIDKQIFHGTLTLRAQ